MPDKISVIITSYEQPPTLRWLLRNLGEQTYQGELEIIVCDDGSESDTVAVVQEAHKRHGYDIRCYWQPHLRYRVARARNNGIGSATGDVLLFLDGDMLIPSDFVELHARAHEGPGERLVSGSRQWVFMEPDRFATLDPHLGIEQLQPFAADEDRDMQTHAASHEKWMACIGCNFSVTRRPEAVFDDHLEGWGAEDREMACRLVHWHGYQPSHYSGLWGYHVYLGTQRDWRRRRLQCSHEEIVLYLRNKFYFRRRFPGIDLTPLFGDLRWLSLDTESNRWRMRPTMHNGYTTAQAIDFVERWLAENNISTEPQPIGGTGPVALSAAMIGAVV